MGSEPWYRTTLRWGQTNLVEIDPARYDDTWWREHWRKTRVQGVIVNAGGIVAYYPSKFPLHHRAAKLGDRDLYGDIVRSAREEGLTVLARMDSNRVAADFYEAHPDWICRDLEGRPYRQADKYVTCINSPYYSAYLPEVMTEIIERSHPDGFTDNSWAGLPRTSICHCENCRTAFRARCGHELPRAHDWADPAYQHWIGWNYQRRTEIWELNNAVTMRAGGEHCRWMGMISGDVLNNCNRFIDLPAILARTAIVMLDHQRRSVTDGFEQNTEAGKRLHELAGWDKLIPESTPQYQLGAPAFRLASMPPAEVRLWSSAGFAGGIQPWWHHIGALHEDRRQYTTAEPIFRWHEANEDILIDRLPEADVGVVWSQANHDAHGRGEANDRTMNPYRGAVRALDRSGIPYIPVHAGDIARATGRFRVLILPNLAAMSAAEVAAVEAHVRAGGSVIATAETSLYDELGARRPDFALAGLFGVHRLEGSHGGWTPPESNIETHARHSYLRLAPERRGGVYGPRDATAPREAHERHPVLAGLDAADTIPFGGYLPVVGVEADSRVLATFIPDFPIYPPETSWMREPRTELPALVTREAASGGRLAWFVADLDRCFAREDQFEHALLFANAIRWALGGHSPVVALEGGHGVITPSLYRQGARQILHLNNRLLLSRVPGRQYDLIPVGPIRLRLPIPSSATPPARISLRVSGQSITPELDGTHLAFTVDQVLDHEVAVIDWGA